MNIQVIDEINTVEWYADKINSHIEKTVEHIINIGKEFISAKENLPHGEFSKLFELTPIGQRTAQKYMKIARSEEIQNILKNEPNSHLSVTKLYQIASGKSEEKPTIKEEPKWWELQEQYYKIPGMPYVDFYKRSEESELMKKTSITYDMKRFLNISYEELNNLILKESEKNPGILTGEFLPIISANEIDIFVIGLGTHENYISGMWKDFEDGFCFNRDKLDQVMRSFSWRIKQHYKDFNITFSLHWMEKKSIIDAGLF